MKTAAVKPAPAHPQTVVMTCAQCGTRITIISLDTNPYPVKLPSFCPCCFHQIGEYQMLDERSAV